MIAKLEMKPDIDLLELPGQAPGRNPILFVHGLLHGSWCWPAPWREFFNKRGLTAHCLSLPGHDGADTGQRTLRWTSLTDYADAVVQAAARFGRCPILVGHSLGAMLIQMRLHKLNPPAAVLLAPTYPAAFRWAAWRRSLRQPGLYFRAHRLGRPRLVIRSLQSCRDWFFCNKTPEDVVANCFARLGEDSYRVCLELLLRPKVIWHAHTSTPVLVLGAGGDGCVERKSVERVAALYGVQAEFFEDMGHDLMLEPGWERAAARILLWLGELGLVTHARGTAPSRPEPCSPQTAGAPSSPASGLQWRSGFD